jgi:hypothetical protein
MSAASKACQHSRLLLDKLRSRTNVSIRQQPSAYVMLSPSPELRSRTKQTKHTTSAPNQRKHTTNAPKRKISRMQAKLRLCHEVSRGRWGVGRFRTTHTHTHTPHMLSRPELLEYPTLTLTHTHTHTHKHHTWVKFIITLAPLVIHDFLALLRRRNSGTHCARADVQKVSPWETATYKSRYREEMVDISGENSSGE